jgi:murein DD-endopeptidase MepM/ murein hydrolase activator NlpD
MKSTKYTVLIIPDNDDQNKQFVLKRNSVRLWITLLSVFIILLIGFGYYFVPKALEYDALSAKYEVLAEERMEVYSLMQDLQRMAQLDVLIRKTLGPEMELPYVDESGDTLTIPAKMNDSLSISFLENFPSQLPLQGYVTQRMSRTSVYRRKNHYGIDIAAKEGEVILSSASGFVVFAGWTYDMGNMIILFHGDGYFTYYGHCQRNLVQSNDVIKRGDVIGLVGSTGVSSGPHLHFEIWKDGEPIDPMDYFPQYYDKDLSVEEHG